MNVLILGNQLFEDWIQGPIAIPKGSRVLLIESKTLAARFRYHRLRLLHQFAAMRSFAEKLKKQNLKVDYVFIDAEVDFFDGLATWVQKHKIKTLTMAEVADRFFQASLREFGESQKIDLNWVSSPQFFCSADRFSGYLKKSKRPFMKTFYEGERQYRKILMDRSGKPVGGRYSFDTENRKKLPLQVPIPELPEISEKNAELSKIRKSIQKFFPDHPGQMDLLWLPYDRAGAVAWMHDFFKNRFSDFGPYEDAISGRGDLLFHSGLSPLMNLGLLNPAEVIQGAIDFASNGRPKSDPFPIESLEGFVRQILGWREFIKGIDQNYGVKQFDLNFFGHHRKLTDAWYTGTTGLAPLDDAIKKADRLAYNHHIERLMVIGNLMMLCQVHPHEVYRWFMEMNLDSYEWVMGPNIFGMSQMSDGGIFATKPYISGSNYYFKMSDLPRASVGDAEWPDVWDGLYWTFISRNIDYFAKNPRLSMMASLVKKMPKEKYQRIEGLAREFTSRVTRE